jgi:lipopolysaccharide/colanic/teichoic acid biosynthesis glycosyltransferase
MKEKGIAVKRAFDLLFASVCLVLSTPLLAALAAAVRLDSQGPALHRSPRVGKNGTSFGMLRFRTVDLQKPAHLPMDQKLTRAGKLLRNFSLDDLPNLFTILAGEMGFVGPRPTEP